jgi:hypothetical protein
VANFGEGDIEGFLNLGREARIALQEADLLDLVEGIGGIGEGVEELEGLVDAGDAATVAEGAAEVDPQEVKLAGEQRLGDFIELIRFFGLELGGVEAVGEGAIVYGVEGAFCGGAGRPGGKRGRGKAAVGFGARFGFGFGRISQCKLSYF